MKKALVIVDMQKDFLLKDGGLFLGHDSSALIKNVSNYAGKFEGMVYFTLDSHKSDDCEFKIFTKHCVQDTRGHEIVDELLEVFKDKQHVKLTKKSFSDENIVHLADTFAEISVKEIHIAGVCVHICIHDIVTTLINHTKSKYSYIPNIVIHRDLIDDFDQEMAEITLNRLQKLYRVKVV